MVTPISDSAGFEAGTPVMLFDGVYEYRSDTAVTYSFDVRNERFLMIGPRRPQTDPIDCACSSTGRRRSVA